MEKHTILEGKVNLYKRERSRYWQCSTYLAGKNRRASTKKEHLPDAKQFAGDWYFGLLGQHRGGELKDGHNFMKAAEAFMKEYPIMTEGQRSPGYVRGSYGSYSHSPPALLWQDECGGYKFRCCAGLSRLAPVG